jgi:hypothetical protein
MTIKSRILAILTTSVVNGDVEERFLGASRTKDLIPARLAAPTLASSLPDEGTQSSLGV